MPGTRSLEAREIESDVAHLVVVRSMRVETIEAALAFSSLVPADVTPQPEDVTPHPKWSNRDGEESARAQERKSRFFIFQFCAETVMSR